MGVTSEPLSFKAFSTPNAASLRVTDVGLHSLQFSWDNLNSDSSYTYYLLNENYVIESGYFASYSQQSVFVLNFNNLKSNTKYSFLVTLTNPFGISFNSSIAVATKVHSPIGLIALLDQPLVAKFIPKYGGNATDPPASGIRLVGYPLGSSSDLLNGGTHYFAAVHPSTYYSLKMFTLNSDNLQSEKYVNASLLVPTVLAPSAATQSASGSKITFEFSDVNYGGNIPYFYTACIEDTTICQQVSPNSGNKLSVTLSNLQPATIYNATFYAKNAYNTSTISLATSFTGVAPPVNVSTITVGSDFIFLDWVESEPLLSETVEYVFTYKLQTNGANSQQYLCTSNSNSKCRRVSLLNLGRVSRYHYNITTRAYYKGIIIENGLQTSGEFATVQGNPPSRAPTFSHGLYGTTVVITFENLPIEIAQTSGIVNYYIEYTVDDVSENWRFEIDKKFVSYSPTTNGNPILTLENLQPGTKYYLRAYASTESGQSDYGVAISIKTEGTAITSDSGIAAAGAITSVLLILFFCLVLFCIIGLIIAVVVTVVILKKSKSRKQFTTSELLLNSELNDMETNFKINYSDLSFTDSKVLGSGAQGTVCSAKYKEALVAVKLFPKSVMGVESDMHDFLTELKFLAKHCHHTNIIRFIGVAEDFKTSTLCLITELYTGGNLATYIEKTTISFAQKISLLRGIASGMSFLHNNNIVHRDLKCENVLLHGTVPKIIDFGLSRQLENTNKTLNLTMNVGTATYLAPEVIKMNVNHQISPNNQQQLVSNTGTIGVETSMTVDHSQSMTEQSIKKKLKYDCKADVYSFAIIMFVVYFRNRNPYGTNVNELQLLYYISQNADYRPKYDESSITKEEIWYIGLMKQCWSTDPDDRPSFAQIIEQIDEHL